MTAAIAQNNLQAAASAATPLPTQPFQQHVPPPFQASAVQSIANANTGTEDEAFHMPEEETSPALVSRATATSELARARAIAQRLGITNLPDDMYGLPTYMRSQKYRELS